MRQKWFKPSVERPDAVLRLFCFHYAGGGANLYRTWGRHLPDTVEVCPIQLPGRETRICDQPYTRLNLLVDDLLTDVFTQQDKPFALFGHSMGAVIAHELAHEIEERALGHLAALMVSGRRAPHLPSTEPDIHTLPEAEFIQKIREFGGTPEEVLEMPELLELLIPLLRSDFELLETQGHVRQSKLSCPIYAFGGTDDVKVPWDTVEGWCEHTKADFDSRQYDGGHFFVQSCQEQLMRDLNLVLSGMKISP